MKYVLILDETKRILSATFPQYLNNGVVVATLPKGNIVDYKYVDGEYVYSPLPKPEPPELPKHTDTEARLTALEDDLAATKILLGVE